MARLDRSGAVPLVGPTERSLREPPVPPPPRGARPLREEPVGADLALFFTAPPGDDHTTSHEILLTLQAVLGEQAVPLPAANRAEGHAVAADEAGVLLLDQPLPDQPLPESLPLDLLHFTAATPLPPADEGPAADEPDADEPDADEPDATALPGPPPIRGPDWPGHGGPDDHHRVRSEGSFARGLVFGVPLSVALWGGIVAAVRWLSGR